MRYLLDTNACIEIRRGSNHGLKERLQSKDGNEVLLCTIVWAELLHGVNLTRNPTAQRKKLQQALGDRRRLTFDDSAAEHDGEIRAILRQSGSIIGANDLFIAAIARAHRLILVTHKTNEFKRVPNLTIEDWQS